MKSEARAIADVSSGVILADVEIAASPERVFQALTDADQIIRWWGSTEAYMTESWTSDLRVGGAWKSKGRGADGTAFHVEGVFLEVAPPLRLVQTWKPSWENGLETTLTYQLHDTGGITRLTVRHEGFGNDAAACQSHASGWEAVLSWLTRHLSPASTAHQPCFYFIRLVPPRPSFALDMTEEEVSIMQAHAAYWTEHLKHGRAIVFGPVGDPAGPWGLGVVRLRDEEELRSFEARDPAIQSGRGFRYEALPMLQAVAA